MRLALNLAEVYLAQGEADKALAQVEQYLRTQPQGMEGYELRIKIQKQLDRAADILPSLIRSARADRNNQALQLLLAREYRKAGQSLPARAIYDRLLEQSPTMEVYRGLFGLYKDEGIQGADRLLLQLDQAIGKAIGNASGDSGKDKKAELNEAQREAAQREAGHARAMLLVLREDPELVKFLMPAATRRLSLRGGLRFTTSFMLANLAGRTRQFPQAEALYRHCLKLGGDNEAEIYVGLLTVLSLAHKNREIIKVCEEGLAKEEPNINRLLFYRELAVAHMGLNHVRESLAAADEAVDKASGLDSKLTCRLERAQLLSQADTSPGGHRRVPGVADGV